MQSLVISDMTNKGSIGQADSFSLGFGWYDGLVCGVPAFVHHDPSLVGLSQIQAAHEEV